MCTGVLLDYPPLRKIPNITNIFPDELLVTTILKMITIGTMNPDLGEILGYLEDSDWMDLISVDDDTSKEWLLSILIGVIKNYEPLLLRADSEETLHNLDFSLIKGNLLLIRG